MNELINAELPKIKVWKGQRVVTFKDIDAVHQRPSGTAKRNFNKNKKHFIENEDYFKITLDEFRTLKNQGDEIRTLKNIHAEEIGKTGLMLFTETGYLMLVKSFRDDLSWSVQRQLVTGYFRGKELEKNLKEQAQAPQPGNYPSLVNKWMHEQEPNFRFICKAYGISRRELYHKILLDIGDEYSVDDYRAYYKRDTGHGAEYVMDVVSYYPELREAAEVVIEIHMRRIRMRPKRFLIG